jgi:hypothetical protein
MAVSIPGTPLAVSATVAAASNNQTLAAAVGRRTYITGFTVSGGGATAASVIQVTVTGLTTTLSFNIAVPAGVANGILPLSLDFDPPLPASADNTAIVVNVPSFGAGNTSASATAMRFQQ